MLFQRNNTFIAIFRLVVLLSDNHIQPSEYPHSLFKIVIKLLNVY